MCNRVPDSCWLFIPYISPYLIFFHSPQLHPGIGFLASTAPKTMLWKGNFLWRMTGFFFWMAQISEVYTPENQLIDPSNGGVEDEFLFHPCSFSWASVKEHVTCFYSFTTNLIWWEHGCIYINSDIYIYTRTRTYYCIHLYTSIYIYIHIHIYIYMYINICIRFYINLLQCQAGVHFFFNSWGPV